MCRQRTFKHGFKARVVLESGFRAKSRNVVQAFSSVQSTRHRPRHSTLVCALACLIDPPTLTAIGLLLLNDHVLKATVPSWWTGKLSDLAGLYFFPFLVLALLSPIENLLSHVHRSPKCTHRLMASALILSGLWFVALKVTPTSNAWAVALLEALTGRTHVVVADPTDLVALVMLPLAWYRWRIRLRNQDSTGTASSIGTAGPVRGILAEHPPLELGAGSARQRRWFSLAVLVVASMATMATTPPYEAYSFGAVFDVAADPAQDDVLYAGLATQRILNCQETESSQQPSSVCLPDEIAYSVEAYRSQDGGRTWSLYTEVGGYLWADPHTSGQLYVLSEEGLYRVEDGRVHPLRVPFEEKHIDFFTYDSGDANVPLNQHPLTFDPITRDVLYMADGQHILVSTNGGESWERRSSVPISARVVALSLAPSAPQTLYAAAGKSVLRSDDGGRHWTRNARLDDGTQIRALAVHPATPETVYAAGSGIWLSVDGGHTWQQVYAGQGLEALALHPSDPDLIYATGREIKIFKGSSSTTVGVVYSDDGGKAWHPLRDQPGWDIAISQADPHRAIVALGEKGIAVQDSPRHNLQQGWQQFSEGLPVFLQRH